jgi:hypothetical protein
LHINFPAFSFGIFRYSWLWISVFIDFFSRIFRPFRSDVLGLFTLSISLLFNFISSLLFSFCSILLASSVIKKESWYFYQFNIFSMFSVPDWSSSKVWWK